MLIEGVSCPNGWNETTECTYTQFDNSIYNGDIELLKDKCYEEVKKAKIEANQSAEEINRKDAVFSQGSKLLYKILPRK